jgi:hypothetical protein
MRNREQIINAIGADDSIETATTFAINVIEKSEQAIRHASQQRGRTYKSLTAAVRNGFGQRWWIGAMRTAVAESLYAAAATDTSASKDRLKEEGFKTAMKVYMPAA